MTKIIYTSLYRRYIRVYTREADRRAILKLRGIEITATVDKSLQIDSKESIMHAWKSWLEASQVHDEQYDPSSNPRLLDHQGKSTR